MTKQIHFFMNFWLLFLSLLAILSFFLCGNLFLKKPNVHKKIELNLISKVQENHTLRLWYNKQSSEIPLKDISNSPFQFDLTKDNLIWQQNTLPIGNGFLGANIYGEITTERVSINEKTLWSGGPSQKRPKYKGGNLKTVGRDGLFIQEIQKLFKEGKNEEAREQCEKLLGDNDMEAFGSYLAFGELQFEFLREKKSRVFDYIRYLDLNTAMSYVEYKYADDKEEISTITREYFASYPDNVICVKFSTDSKSRKMKINGRFLSSNEAKTTIEKNQITIEGELNDNQMKFIGKMAVVTKNGFIQYKSDSILIEDTNEAVFFVSAKTDYKNIYPRYRSGETKEDLNKKVEQIIEKAVNKGYEKVKEDHLKDYQKIFNRVEINIGQQPSKLPTNELLNKYAEYYKNDFNKYGMNYTDMDNHLLPQFRYLEVLLFQYGRYLTIASSREGSLPSNLQGIWNDQTVNVPWMSDYHININLQMNYFPTFNTNMAVECGTPLLDFIESIQIPGRLTAGIYTGIYSHGEEKNGFMAHTRLNPFGYTAPGYNFYWGWSPTAILWILHNVFELFLYTNNVELLRTRIYPMLKEEANYFEHLFIKDEKNNRIITSPTFSPEHGPPTSGNTYEQTILWQHFTNTLTAAKILNVDKDQWKKWEKLLTSFKPIEIGLSGQIKEWYEETSLGSIGEKGHRHMSHLLGLFPFDLINSETPEWLEAAKISMNDRGDESTGWGMGQRINAWARAGDGNRAFKLIRDLLKNGIYSNLWDTHPPFQIDGNFAATSGIAEMLLQSKYNHIHVLPALPRCWGLKGSFKGLVAKGNIVVSCNWEYGRAYEIFIEPKFSCKLEVRSKGAEEATVFEKNSNKKVDFELLKNSKIVFNVTEGNVYLIQIEKACPVCGPDD